MNTLLSDTSLYKLNHVFYPRGYIFAMFATTQAADATAAELATIEGIGTIEVVSSGAITEHLAERADEGTSILPSVGRELQFMRRFVELAREGLCGLLVELASAEVELVARLLDSGKAELAYEYKLLTIEELIVSSRRANDAASDGS